MKGVKRTAQCRKCGGVLFKIKPSRGHVSYYCVDCHDELSTVEYDNYETSLPTCSVCDGDTFKIRITVDEQNSSHESWVPECINCKGTPKSVYVDNEGNLINESERKFLILKDRIVELEEEIETKNRTIKQLEEEISYLNYEVEEKISTTTI